MTSPSTRDREAACLLSLESALVAGGLPDLDRCTAEVLDSALKVLVSRHGAAAAPLLRTIADHAPARPLRRTARLAIYRLGRGGITVPPSRDRATVGPFVRRQADQPRRAWLSGIDGTGSRAVWILFEGGLGGQLSLCSLILNDQAGILEAAGGAITRKRLETELRGLREHQKLPWVDSDPTRACALVAEALALHARVATEPPPEFSRWRRLFTVGGPPSDAPPTAAVDSALLDRSAEILELSELAGWFVDPESIHEDTVALLQVRESRLVVSEQIKAEREAAIVDAVIDKEFGPEARRRWARRLAEMASIFRATGREEPARLADNAGAALDEDTRVARHIPFVRALAMRGLTIGTEVVLGRVKAAEVSREPQPPARRPSNRTPPS